MTAKRFAGDLSFLMAVIVVWYCVMMTALSLAEGGVTATEYANGVRPALEQADHVNGLYYLTR